MKQSTAIIEPGFYQTNMGGASLGECWRLSRNPLEFFIVLFMKLARVKMKDLQWLPSSEAIMYCDIEDLEEKTRTKLSTEAEKAASFGFRNGRYYTMKETHRITEGYEESGCYTALHDDKKRSITIIYACTHTKIPHSDKVVEIENLQYNIDFFDARQQTPSIFHNHKSHLDGCGIGNIIYLRTSDMMVIAERAEKELYNFEHPVQSFQDLEHHNEFAWSFEDKLWLHRINRGFFVKVPADVEGKLCENL